MCTEYKPKTQQLRHHDRCRTEAHAHWAEVESGEVGHRGIPSIVSASTTGSADPTQKLKLALAKDRAWSTLPLEARQQLYELVPSPRKGASPHDPDVNPMNTELQPCIERGLEKWHTALKEGRHTKQGRASLAKAQRMRMEGKFAGVDKRRGLSETEEPEVPKNERDTPTAVSESDGKATPGKLDV